MSRDTGIVAVRKNATRFNIVDRDEYETIAVVYKGSKTDEEHEVCAKTLAAANRLADELNRLRDVVSTEDSANIETLLRETGMLE